MARPLVGKKPQAKKCDAMAGITEEGGSIIALVAMKEHD